MHRSVARCFYKYFFCVRFSLVEKINDLNNYVYLKYVSKYAWNWYRYSKISPFIQLFKKIMTFSYLHYIGTKIEVKIFKSKFKSELDSWFFSDFTALLYTALKALVWLILAMFVGCCTLQPNSFQNKHLFRCYKVDVTLSKLKSSLPNCTRTRTI